MDHNDFAAFDRRRARARAEERAAARAALNPYRAEERGGYWLLIDSRTGEPASYPTTEKNCRDEAAFMNRTYRELIAEENKQ